jgi:hypothetical protein
MTTALRTRSCASLHAVGVEGEECYSVTDVLVRGEWPARWEPQEEGMMSVAASFPSVRNQGLSNRRGETDD